MPENHEAILYQLDSLRSNWRLNSALCHAVLALVTASVTIGLLILADAVVHLADGRLRWLFTLWVLASLGLLVGMLVRSLIRQRSLAATARRVEMTFPELGSDLINLVQLTETSGDASDEFRQAAIKDVVDRAAAIPFDSIAEHQTRWQRWKWRLQTPRDLAECCAVLVLVIGLQCALGFLLPRWSESTGRVFRSWSAGERIETTAEPDDTVSLVNIEFPTRKAC